MKPLAIEIKESWRHLESRVDGANTLATGLTSLDRLTDGGMPLGGVTLLVGDVDAIRAICVTVANQVAAVQAFPTGLLTMDRQTSMLGLRFLSMHSGLPLTGMKPGRTLPETRWAELMRSADALSKAPIFVDDAPLVSLEALRSKMLEGVREHDLRFVVVERLDGLADDSGEPLAQICGALHDVAREARCTVFASTCDMTAPRERGRGHAATSAARLARHVDALWFLERSGAEVTVRIEKGPGASRTTRLAFDRGAGRIEEVPADRAPKARRRRRAGTLALDLAHVDGG